MIDDEVIQANILKKLPKAVVELVGKHSVHWNYTKMETLDALSEILAQEVNKTDKVTRFEVVDHSKDFKGRCYSKWDCQVELSYQDDGRTLKVFVSDRKAGLV